MESMLIIAIIIIVTSLAVRHLLQALRVPGGSLSGFTKSDAGDVIPGVSMNMAGPNVNFDIVSDENGAYLFPKVPIGDYAIYARKDNADGSYYIFDNVLSIGEADLIQDLTLEREGVYETADNRSAAIGIHCLSTVCSTRSEVL